MRTIQQVSLIFLVLLLPSHSLLASTIAPYYQVETLIFSHITPDSLSSEHWLNEASPTRAAETLSPSTTPFPTPTQGTMTLTRESRRIDQAAGYRLLAHSAWIIPVQDLKKTVTLPVAGGNYYDQSGRALYLQDITNLSSTPYSRELSGTLSISLDRYFNTQFNLSLSEPTDQLNSLDTTQQFSDWHNPLFAFTLHQQRRMPSRELNYLGHPLLGILIKITPKPTLTETDYEHLKTHTANSKKTL